MFEEEMKYFKENQSGLVRKFLGRVLVIKGNTVVGNYETPLEAYTEAKKIYEPGSFMIQPCTPGEDAYTVTIATHGDYKSNLSGSEVILERPENARNIKRGYW